MRANGRLGSLTNRTGCRHRGRKARASWFENLRDQICAAFEKLEDEAPALYPGAPAASCARRGSAPIIPAAKGGGGVMSVMRGRLFEKVGVHCSTVHGEFAPNSARKFRAPPTIRASGPPAFR